jgi:hypothetical protein
MEADRLKAAAQPNSDFAKAYRLATVTASQFKGRGMKAQKTGEWPFRCRATPRAR